MSKEEFSELKALFHSIVTAESASTPRQFHLSMKVMQFDFIEPCELYQYCNHYCLSNIGCIVSSI